jgi:ADP-ribose pyrophosphatase YjhB (NUDIX family)
MNMPNAAESSAENQPPSLKFRLAQAIFLFIARFTRGMTLGVRGMIIDANDQVFLVRHSYVNGWHMPGGGVEAGETLEEALVKELREEGNIVITGEVKLLGVCLNQKASKRDHVAVYLVRHFEQTSPRLADREIVETGFFPLSNLPAGTTTATRRRIAEATAGSPPSQHW